MPSHHPRRPAVSTLVNGLLSSKRLVEHHPPRRYSPVESRALPRAAAGRYESRRLVRLALGPFRWFRPNPRACTC